MPNLGSKQPTPPERIRARASKGSSAVEKSQRSGRWAETMFRALTRRVGRRWQFVSFRGRRGSESRGVVDVLAVRRCMTPNRDAVLKAGDLFDIILVQLKGGDAPMPTKEDVARLRKVARYYRARRIVLYTWKRGSHSRYYTLESRGSWELTSAAEAFA
jgi:hypothetical protein